jgi:hypothetical protein
LKIILEFDVPDFVQWWEVINTLKELVTIVSSVANTNRAVLANVRIKRF